MHVIASLAERTGGPAQAAIGMACAVARLGHEVAIYTTDRALDPSEAPPPGEPVRRDGVEIRYFREHAPRVFATSFPLARALSARIPQVDLVHIHSLYLFHDWAVGRLCRKYGVPYLLRPHGTLDPYLWQRHRARKWIVERLFQNSVTRHAAALHYTAEDEMRLAEPYALGTPGVVVANGIELAAFAALPPPGRLRAAHPEIGDRRIVLFLGRLNFKKGLDLLIPAFAQTQARHADLQLVIAGPDDGSRADAERLVAAAGIGAHVTFTGMLKGEAKLAAYRDAAMFVLSSYSENFGIAIVEAMACGLPVAITDKVNIWREVAAAGAGLVGPPTVAAVADQLARLAADREAAAAMGAKGRALAEKFSWDRIARDLEAVYRSLARRNA